MGGGVRASGQADVAAGTADIHDGVEPGRATRPDRLAHRVGPARPSQGQVTGRRRSEQDGRPPPGRTGNRPAARPPVGTITAPADAAAAVQTCAYFAGTSRLPADTTLLLAKRNLSTDANPRYAEFVFGWDTPTQLGSWRGARYFGPGDDSAGQTYRVELIAVDLHKARQADRSDGSMHDLPDVGTVLASITVRRVPGEAPNDPCETDTCRAAAAAGASEQRSWIDTATGARATTIRVVDRAYCPGFRCV